VGGGVKDDGGFISSHNLLCFVFTSDIADKRGNIEMWKMGGQFPMDVKDVGFPVVQQDQLLWIISGDLTAQLRADGPASPGDQNPGPDYESSHLLKVNGDRLATQQVFQLDVSDLADAH
jgi:hypothetical protein